MKPKHYENPEALIGQRGEKGSRNGVHLSIGKIRLFAGVSPSSITRSREGNGAAIQQSPSRLHPGNFFLFPLL